MSSSNSWAGRSGLRCIVFLWAVTCGASELVADYKDSYRAGIVAIDEKRWEDAKAHMRAAIHEQPRESRQRIKVYGNLWIPYLPYYFLGLARNQTGDCSGALETWEISERQGAIQGKEARKLAQMRAKCQEQAQRLPAPPPSPPPSRQDAPAPPDPEVDSAKLGRALEEAALRIGQAEDAARDLEELETIIAEHSPGLVEKLVDARERIRVARDGLDLAHAAEDIAAVEEAGHQAALAREKLNSLKQAWIRLREELATEAQAAEESQAAEEARQRAIYALDQISADARQLVSMALIGDTNVQATRKVLQELLRQIRSATGGKSAVELDQLRERLASAVESLRLALENAPKPPLQPPPSPPPPAVPAVLQKAAQAFFHADYSAVLEILEEANLTLSKARATARLLSAAARYSLFLEGGGQDTDLREAAAADAAACQKLDPRLVPAPPFFSPAFTEFFHASR